MRVRKDEDEEMLNVEVKYFDKGDEEVTDAVKADAEKTSKVKDDAKKIELPPTSSSLSTSLDAEINSLLEVKIQSEVPHIQSPSMLRVPVSVISEPSILTSLQESPSIATVITLPPPSVSTTPSTPTVDLEQGFKKCALEILKIKREQVEKQQTPKFTIKSTNKAALKESDQKSALYQTMHANKSFNRNPANHRLYHALMKALIDDENAMDKEVADTGKKIKRIRTKELDSSKKPSTTKETSKGKAPSKGSKTGKSALKNEPVKEPIAEVVMDDVGNDVDPLTFNDLMATPIDFSKYVLNRLKIDNLTQDILLGHAYNLLKGDCYPFDMSKPLPLQGYPGHLTVAADYFFNNDLEYLKSSDPKRTYTTSITKTKAARVESVSVKKLHEYGHLEEIIVKRADRKFYKFKEGDFVDLHLNDIEDMLLLVVQHKLYHLTDSDIIYFIVALHMFIRSLVIKKRIDDLQLGVESYQKKLNITPPQQTFSKIEFKELYTPSHKPPRVIYKDLNKQKRVMQADELYKFLDGTLKKVQDELHHIICYFCLEYNKEMPRRK
nr:hypothetical protein [Tanacetum cinerariifolium]